MSIVPSSTEASVSIVHPLTPLSADEITKAVNSIKAAGKATESTRFVVVTLHEPPKQVVFDWAPGQAVAREAFCVLLEKSTAQTFEVIVNLDTASIRSCELREGVQPAITLDEFFECEEMLKQHPDFIAAVNKRGVTDLDLLMVDPWSAGAYHTDLPEAERRRLVRALTWVRGEAGDNGYARPLQGLMALVDLNKLELVQLEDVGVTPIPPEPGNYAPRFLPKLRPALKDLEIHQPEGPGFSVDGNLIEWQGWSMRVGFTPREGLVIHQVSYDDEGNKRPIFYRASLVDMIVPYGDPAQDHARKNAFDCGEYGIGMLANSLALGCDCLGFIKYFDAHVVNSKGEPVTIKNAICLHEEDYGILWKHVDWRTNETELRRSRRLVVSFISTVGNYEYGFYWYFYLDGNIQYEVKLTGIINTGALPVGEKRKYGSLVAPGLYGPIHQHIFSVRMDMTLDGMHNTAQEVNTYAAPEGEDNPYGNAFYAEAASLTTETARDLSLESARYWKVINPGVKNAVGEPVAYKFMLNENAFPFVSKNSAVRRRAGYMDHHFWVTPFDEKEKYAVGDYPNQRSPEIKDGLPAWIEQGRSTENTNIVCWLTLNAHHVVRPEDFPVMPCSYIGFLMKPTGFFNRNPAIHMPPAPSKHSVEVGSADTAKDGGCCH